MLDCRLMSIATSDVEKKMFGGKTMGVKTQNLEKLLPFFLCFSQQLKLVYEVLKQPVYTSYDVITGERAQYIIHVKGAKSAPTYQFQFHIAPPKQFFK